MSSIQERLQLKRVPLDTWNIREQLCLASAVVRSGDQNWMSVSRAIKTIGEATRPPDWYSQKSCAAQYGVLLENVETPKRKKRNSEGAVETPQESIYKLLTQQRIAEIQNTLTEMNNQYEQLKNEVAEVSNPSTSEERLQELWAGVEAAKRARERENARRAAWLKEREDRRARAERTWRPTTTPPSTPSPAPPSSPLLTSLLKSSPVVTTPQHIPHPATIVDAVSPSAGAPTLSLLLEQGQRESKHAAIEHIKSQLVQIEHQLKASSSSPVVPAVPVPAVVPGAAPVPAVDIDDIEIKAEDVYAFRDVDIHLPPVTAIHKPARTPEKATLKRDEEAPAPPPVEEEVLLKEEPAQAEAMVADVTSDVEMSEEPESTSKQEPEAPEPEIKVTEVEVAPEVALEVTEVEVKFPAAEVKFPPPEVKFPTPEIKIIAPDDDQVKEEMKGEAESTAVEDAPPDPPPADETPERSDVTEESIPEPAEAAPPAPPAPPAPAAPAAEPPAVDPSDIPLPPGDPAPPPTDIASIPSPDGPAPADSPSELEMIQREMEGQAGRADVDDGRTDVQDGQTDADADRTDEQDVKKEDDAEDSIPLKEMMEGVAGGGAGGGAGGEAREDDNTETDDDTPMELSREEEKDGKKKRDYSRKKKSDSRTCSGSESAAEASAPESPSAADERQHRLWRKSVMLVYSRLCAHKYASLFLRPISDEEAPGYSTVVKRPMDLTTIRRHIDAGRIRSTAELQRDVLLMLANALMYNSSRHSVYTMAREMHEEAQNQLGMLLAAQAHAGLVAEPPRRKRRPAAHATPTKRRHT
ncbi:bromodomain-containing protein 8 isoform X2 [Aricia agestis]|uniref:bromodomain-containing protein 8 isoform X2 n=1 Tax=Aricia agestis TaxID=91739 RepID=UPI001C205BB8|nr:bromodomain-containing protein 8 isoform X2 [Aricia agestis]